MPGSTVTTIPGRNSSSPPVFAEGGEFVDFAADAVAETVAEFLAVAGFFDDVAGNAVGLERGDAGGA